MIDYIIAFLLLLSATVILLAAIGLLRLPDLPTRMHATTKSSVLAIVLIMLAVGLFFAQVDVSARVLAIVVFTLITAPIAAHAIGRAGYLSGLQLWSETVRDDLRVYYYGDETGNNKTDNNQQQNND